MAVATSASENIAPSSQSMDKSPVTNSANAAAATEPLSAVAGSSSAITADLSDNSNSSSSPSRQLEIQPSLRSEEYRQLFRLPPEEVLIQDFNCALQENFILQGHMYLFVHHICFYSNLFGFETKKVIPFDEITSVKRAKTAGIFPTAIELLASEKKFFFTSFLSRDEAFKLINDGWVAHGNGTKAISDQQGSRFESVEEESEIVMVKDSDDIKPLHDDLENTNRNTDDYVSEDPNASRGVETEVSASLTSSGVQDTVDEDSVLVQNADCSSSGKSLAWEMEDCDAPNVPEGYTLAAESKFPIKVDEFYNLFFSDDSLPFLESFHKKCGDKDLRCTSWKPHDQFGYAREVSFQHPIKIYFGARFGSCNEVQTFRVYRNSHLVVKTSQEISDVPYGDYFCVEGLWDVVADSSDGCTLRVYVNVAFSKKTMWKGKIVQATIEECRDTFAAFIELANALLKQKNIDKEANLIRETEINRETRVQTLEHTEISCEERHTTSDALPQSAEARHISTSVQGTLSGSSSFRDSVRKLFSSFKSPNQLPSLVIVFLFVVVILMQMSIIALLLRPQPSQVAFESAWMNARIDRRAETVTLLNKQIDHLKEEMLIVDTLREKMQHEHDMLIVQLKNVMLQKTSFSR